MRMRISSQVTPLETWGYKIKIINRGDVLALRVGEFSEHFRNENRANKKHFS